MKKFTVLLLVIVFIFLPYIFIGEKVCSENKQVKVVTECSLYAAPKTSYEEGEEGILGTLSFGEVLSVTGEVEGDSFNFYYVLHQSGDYGYVIKNFVVDIEVASLGRKLDPNAKILNKTNVYNSQNEEDKLFINGEEVVLNKNQDIKIVEIYDSTKEFHKVLFEIDGEIYTGLIKTSDLLVEGYSATLIFIVFLFFLAISLIVSIYFTTRKKRKKIAKNKLSH